VIKAYQAVGSIIGTALGPMSPGTAYVLLASRDGGCGRQCRLMGLFARRNGRDHQGADRQLAGCGGRGADRVRCAQVLVQNGRAVGVALENGDEHRARRVISNMDVRRTFLRHVEAKELPGDFLHRVQRFKTRGSSGKLNIALDGVPRFTALPEGAPNVKGDMHFTDSDRKDGSRL
jgi:hypothetical protein